MFCLFWLGLEPRFLTVLRRQLPMSVTATVFHFALHKTTKMNGQSLNYQIEVCLFAKYGCEQEKIRFYKGRY